MIPLKSSDLESYLASLSAFNEGVYCEPFRVSDFTDDGMEVSEAMEKRLILTYVLQYTLLLQHLLKASANRDYHCRTT